MMKPCASSAPTFYHVDFEMKREKEEKRFKKTDAKDSLGFAGFLLYRNFYHIPLVTKLHRSWKTLRSYIVQKWKAVLFSNMSEIRKTWRCTHLHQTLCISTRFDLTLLPSAHHWWSLLWRWPSTVRDLKSQHFRRSRGALRQKWVFSWAADVGWSGRTHHNLVFVSFYVDHDSKYFKITS